MADLEEAVELLDTFQAGDEKDGFIRKFVNNGGNIETKYIPINEVLEKYIEYCEQAMISGLVDFRLDIESEELTNFYNSFMSALDI